MRELKVHFRGQAAEQMFPGQGLDYWPDAICGAWRGDIDLTSFLDSVTCKNCLEIITAAKRKAKEKQ